MSDVENFFNNSEIQEFNERLENDLNFLETIKNNKYLLTRNSINNFKMKLFMILEKDINPFDFYLTQRTFDIKDCLDVVINYYSQKNNLSVLCNIINDFQGSNDMSFWGVLQNLKYINMVYSNNHQLTELTKCCREVFDKNKKKYNFNGMNKFL